jgi:RNA polymerase sigma factor (sigma-70 family)
VETELIERARRGDRDAFAELIAPRTATLFMTAQRILRDIDAAEDATQDALVEAWADIPQLRDVGRFDAWLRRILVHACYDECRRRRTLAAHVRTVDDIPTSSGVADIAERDRIEHAFRRLTMDQRAILVLHHYLGLDPSEIAGTLGIPAPTARTRLHYAHRAMRAAVEADARAEPSGVTVR